ncbi:DNA cross-link repair protein SNM1 [Gastrolobium bilobum]|uniref:DNA cross-link repair protein SNM1 n=1 Tax=Gastrolobium bilobum TaxID=150636 RepID=UPI002AB0B421|nr:DNA cross-link repair protein SNM1 [Gastrolobium bilobum]
MQLSTTAGAASPPPALEEERLPHDGEGYDLNEDGAPISVVSLDDEGFPSQVLGEDGSPNGSVTASEKGSFAADFYRGGTDWSSLLSPEDQSDRDFARDSVPSEKKLKQANLFQIWGFKRNETVGSVESEPNQSCNCDDGGEGGASSERKIVKPENWGSILRDTGKVFENPKFSRKRKDSHGESRVTRACPFYKKIPGTTFTVDAFRYGCVEGCSAYFLSHFHSDHYGGLSKKWSHGPIYCSPLTGRLVQMCLSVNPLYIHPLEFNIEHLIDGVKVTLLEANHCPGAALIHFGLPNGQRYLHTGDFRACKQMQAYHLLVNQRVNVLYLDTTYCNPKYKFPSKEDVLNYVVKITKNHLKMHPRTLVVVGAYSIGKECVYLAISKALGVKIYANASRRRILLAFGWPDFSDSLCTNGNNTLLHVLPMSSLRFETLKDYVKTYKEQFTSILAFRPTGWTFSEKTRNDLDLIKPISKGNITIYGVPYSEHSSFTELRDFVQFLRPDKIVPTVNVGNATNREKMQSYFRDWLKG